MTKRKASDALFPACKSRKVEVDFEGGDISSDGGLLLVRQVDRHLGLTRRASRRLADPRRRERCEHSTLTMLRQRVYGLVAGHEDLNDHTELRKDVLLQTVVERDEPMASAPTLCRFENWMDRRTAVRVMELMVDVFIESHVKAPKEVVLDFDATDNPVHGLQEGRFFNAYYDCHCFLPLYVFCGDQLLVAYLRESGQDGARHAWAVLGLLTRRLKAAWPEVRIIFRGDSGFCRPAMLEWMEFKGIDYVVGLAKNSRINALAEPLQEAAQEDFETSGRKCQLVGEVSYAAGTWRRERRVVVRAEHGPRGANPRYVVTTLADPAERVYREIYCARGDMENRIKEQMMLFSTRVSAHAWWANQFRLLLSGLGYILMERLRALGLAGTSLARAECRTIRTRLIKIGAVITRNTRRVRVHLSSSHPAQNIFLAVAKRLATL